MHIKHVNRIPTNQKCKKSLSLQMTLRPGVVRSYQCSIYQISIYFSAVHEKKLTTQFPLMRTPKRGRHFWKGSALKIYDFFKFPFLEPNSKRIIRKAMPLWIGMYNGPQSNVHSLANGEQIPAQLGKRMEITFHGVVISNANFRCDLGKGLVKHFMQITLVAVFTQHCLKNSNGPSVFLNPTRIPGFKLMILSWAPETHLMHSCEKRAEPVM